MTKQITGLLQAASHGDRDAYDAVVPLVYDALRGIAGARMRAERGDHTLTPTALVHEAYLKLANIDRIEWQNRAHFYAVAARVMRQVLADHARSRSAQKRGDRELRVTLDEAVGTVEPSDHDVLDLEEALVRMEQHHPRRVHVVACRLFAGMQVEETAEALGISAATVKREWSAARAWLNRELGCRSETGP